MNIKSRVMSALVVLSGFFISACTASPTKQLNSIEIWQQVLWFGSLGWLGASAESPIISFMRIIIFFLIFALLYELSKFLAIKGQPLLSKNIKITIAGLISLMSVIFFPGSLLLAIGTAYATVIAVVMIGSIVVGGMYAYYSIEPNSPGQRILRLAILIFLLILVTSIDHTATGLLSVGPISIGPPPGFGP